MNIVSFSGGKDSTAMLFMMLEKGISVDRVIFVDTTKEFPQMYEHIEKVKSMISPIKIETVKIDYDYWFEKYIIPKGDRKGKSGYGWANIKFRWCTAVKINAFRHIALSLPYNPIEQKEIPEKALIQLGIIEFQGIAFDEKKRAERSKRTNVRYPLIEWGTTEQQALEYCYSKGFDWGGLYKIMKRVSCWCCPFSRISELKILHDNFPKLWNKLKEMDKKAYNKFRADYTVEQLTKKFEEPLLDIKNEDSTGSVTKASNGGSEI